MGSGALALPCLVRRSCATLVVILHGWFLPLSWGHGTMVRCMHGAGGERGCRSHSYPWAKVVYHAEGERGSHVPMPAYPFACRMSWLSPGQGSGTLSLMSGDSEGRSLVAEAAHCTITRTLHGCSASALSFSR